MWRSVFVRLCLAALGLLCAFWPARAQSNFPNRPITMVVPLPAGGTADLLARIAAEQIRNVLGQSVVVENRPGGAGGLVGTESVFKAADRKSTRLNSSHIQKSRMPSSA